MQRLPWPMDMCQGCQQTMIVRKVRTGEASDTLQPQSSKGCDLHLLR